MSTMQLLAEEVPKRTSGGSFRLTLKSAELEALYTAAGRLMIMPTAFNELE